MPTKSVDIEVNLGVKDSARKDRIDALAKARQLPDPLERAQAIMQAKQAYEKVQAKKAGADVSELEKAHAAELARARKKHEDRLAAQRARDADKQSRRQTLLQNRAAKDQERHTKLQAREEEREWKKTIGFQRRWTRGIPLQSVEELNAQDAIKAATARMRGDIRGDSFNPLGRPHSRTDLGHKATSEDRIQRGVKEAEEVENRLGRKGTSGRLGRIVSGIGQTPSLLAMGFATGHPGFIPGAIGVAGHKLRQYGEKRFESNQKALDLDEELTALQKAAPPMLKIAGAGMMAVGALGMASINKRLEISRERARLELPMYRAMAAASEDVSYMVPGVGRQSAKRFHGPGGTAVDHRTGAVVDPTAPRGREERSLREQMPGGNMFRIFAETYGIAPDEAAGMVENFAVGTGVPNSITPKVLDILAQSRMRGIDLGTIAQTARLAGPGGGATYGAARPGESGEIGETLSRIIGSAESLGLRGSRIDEYLRRTSAATSQLADKGFMMSVNGANELALAINKSAGKLGTSEASGMGALRTAQRLQMLGPQTAAQLGTQMFAPLARGVMLAKGMEGATSLTDFFGNLSDLSKQQTGGLDTIEAFRKYLGGGEGATMGLLGAGESLRTAQTALETRRLAGAPEMPMVQPRDFRASFGVSRALANRDVSRVEEASIRTAETLVQILEKMDQVILTFTDQDSAMMKLLRLLEESLPYVVDAARSL